MTKSIYLCAYELTGYAQGDPIEVSVTLQSALNERVSDGRTRRLPDKLSQPQYLPHTYTHTHSTHTCHMWWAEGVWLMPWRLSARNEDVATFALKTNFEN